LTLSPRPGIIQAPAPPGFMSGGLSLGQLMSTRRFARGANQPIRLFQNVGIFWLFSRKKADHHERRAK
jgi:hypothetical protein